MRNQRTSMPNKLNESVFRSVLIAGTGFLQAWEWFGDNIAEQDSTGRSGSFLVYQINFALTDEALIFFSQQAFFI